jgi:hypothetical protein
MTAVRSVAVATFVLTVILIAATPALAAAGDVLGFQAYSQAGSTGTDVAAAVKVDAAGDPIFTGWWAATSPTREFITCSMTSTSAWRWEKHWTGTGGSAFAYDMALDGSGNAYDVGVTNSPGAGDDNFALVRYLNDGTPSWSREYDGPAGGNDEASVIACDAAGDCYIAGYSQGADGHNEIATLKYDSGGTLVWAKRLRSPWATNLECEGIALHGGALYFAGSVTHPGHGEDLVVVKYDAFTGTRRWVRYYDDPLHRSETTADVVATPTSVYVCGTGRYTSLHKGVALLVRYSASGKRIWAKTFSGGSRLYDQGFADMQRSPAGDVVTSAYVGRRATGIDMATVAWRADGSVHWAHICSSAGMGIDEATALDIDDGGRVYVVGTLQYVSGFDHLRVICYTKGGATS